jgi:Domain of unknown function (DUF6754)
MHHPMWWHLSVWLVAAGLGLTLAPCVVRAVEAPQPVVSDTPNDWGTSLTLKWKAAPPADSVSGYEIWRAVATAGARAEPMPSAAWEETKQVAASDTSFVDSGLSRSVHYSYTLVAISRTARAASDPTIALAPKRQIIIRDRINVLVAVVAFVLTVVALVEWARRGAKLFIRRIAGLEAVEEAVGRATEMGRPILYVPGLDPMDEVATVAAVDILGQVAKKAGQYETKLIVPTTDPIVMTVAQQVVRESFSAVGKPHLYRDEQVFYVTNSQFGFAAAVAGIMMREKPATNFLIGHFYAEALVLAETGNATGAIQIAGTDADAQLPFFITSCDYTLIGEELYAGAVYLSRRPLLLGALKSQDYAKVLLIAAMLAGIILSAVNPDLAMKFRAVFK